MKKKNILIALIFVICVPSFAQKTQYIDTLITRELRGLNKNFATIQQEAASFDETERLEIYNQYKKNVWLGGLINVLLPGGIGSFYQGDYIAGGIIVGGELLGFGMFSVGTMMTFIPLIMVFPVLTEEGSRVIENGIIITTVGGVITVASYLFGIIRAFYYPHTYNKKLKAALWLESDSLKVSIIPSLNITGNDVVVTVLKLKW